MQKTVHKISLKYQIKSFGWAIVGLSYFFRSEIKPWLHLLGSILTIVAGILFGINKTEWLFIILAIGIVFLAEILNTILERISEFIPDKHDAMRGRIKDMSAGLVLFTAIISLSIGIAIFLPDILELKYLFYVDLGDF